MRLPGKTLWGRKFWLGGAVILLAAASQGQVAWQGYAKDAQHTAQSGVSSQALEAIIWQTPVDLQPQLTSSGVLLIHYGSPVITSSNTVIIPVKTGATDGFELEARSGADGALLWTQSTDYTLPPYNWIPVYGPTLTPQSRVYWAGAGGTVYFRTNPDAVGSVTPTQVVFYGSNVYRKSKATFNSAIQINTPLTCDASGNIYFGYQSTAVPPATGKKKKKQKKNQAPASGFVRIDMNGNATFATVAALTGGQAAKPAMNCAPALSNDGRTLYVVANGGGTSGTAGYLLALNSSTLTKRAMVLLADPATAFAARITDNSSASPTVGPDGNVFMGVLEYPFFNSHGWLLQFSSDLSQQFVPGAFGWDDTASIVPAPLVPSYQGTSSYLLMVKYNNYAGVGGGDGKNKVAILDPKNAQTETRTGINVMKEVLTILGQTPDNDHPTFPGAVTEWCINTAAVDPFSHSVLVNNEDGKIYRWDLATNTLSETVDMTAGLIEAYTPTLLGPDGKVYAINNGILFAIGAGP